MLDLLDKRLIFVTGKGGVGKSTVAAALGMVAARRGLRTIVAEVARQDRVSRTFAGDGSTPAPAAEEVELAPGLFAISIDPRAAMEEYLRDQIRFGPLADMLASSRSFELFAAATPGMRELLTIGKIWELAQLERRTRGAARYDLVIVDAPATGHGVGFLRTPRTFAEIARVGPIARQGRIIHDTIADPSHTGVVAVTQPGEMPVNETLLLRSELERTMGMALDGVIVNGLYPPRFDAQDEAVLREALDSVDGRARAAVRAALSQRARAGIQRLQLARLQEGLPGTELVTLPFLFAPRIGPEELESLSRSLEGAAA